MTWTHNICKKCWNVREGDRTPHRIIHGDTICCVCGEQNSDGIFFRCNPAMLFNCKCEE